MRTSKLLGSVILTSMLLAASALADSHTVKEVVESQLPGDVREHFLAQAKQEGVDYANISDVEITVDEVSGKVAVQGTSTKHKREELLFVGVQLGLLMPFGLNGTLMFTKDDHPEWDVDLSWEPSNYLQSYSVGGAYHPFKGAFFVGARIREMQLHAPWSRGYDSHFDNQVGIGPEIGFRGWFDQGQHWLGSVSVGAIYIPSDNTSLPVMYTLNVGLAYRAFKRTN